MPATRTPEKYFCILIIRNIISRNIIFRKILKTHIITLLVLFSVNAFSAQSHLDELTAQKIKLSNYSQLKNKFQQKKSSSNIRTQKSSIEPQTIRIIVETESSAASSTSILNAYGSLEKLEARSLAQGADIQRKLERFNLLSMDVDEKQLDTLFKDNDVITLSEDRFISPSLNVSTPFIGATQLHQTEGTGNGQAVAILDTGFDKSHPFLASKIVEEACFSSGDRQRVFSLCPNTQNRQIGEGAARDCFRTIGVSDCMHGTHVAGIVAGASSSMSGVAPDASIVAVQVFTYNPSFFRLGAYTSDIIAALDWIIYESNTPNIAAINLSLGDGAYSDYCDADVPALTAAINLAREHGIATVIASGNNGSLTGVSWPGCISSAITVGAGLRNENSIAGYSNISPLVDVIAPGDEIYSSIPGGVYSAMSGTSMAAPQVTGAFALLKSLIPTANVDELELALEQTGKTILTSSGINLPRIDLFAAHQHLIGDGDDTNTDCIGLLGTIVESVGTIANGQTKTWNVSVNEGGLYRFWIKNDAPLYSQSIRATLNSQIVHISIGAGQTTLIDFVDVTGGTNVFSITALSDDVMLGKIWAEKLVGNNNIGASCQAALTAGVVMNNLGDIPEGTEKILPIKTTAISNLRIYITSTSLLNSRNVLLQLNGTAINLSLDHGMKTPVDFPGLVAGNHSLIIKALNNDVAIGEVELATF